MAREVESPQMEAVHSREIPLVHFFLGVDLLLLFNLINKEKKKIS